MYAGAVESTLWPIIDACFFPTRALALAATAIATTHSVRITCALRLSCFEPASSSLSGYPALRGAQLPVVRGPAFDAPSTESPSQPQPVRPSVTAEWKLPPAFHTLAVMLPLLAGLGAFLAVARRKRMSSTSPAPAWALATVTGERVDSRAEDSAPQARRPPFDPIGPEDPGKGTQRRLEVLHGWMALAAALVACNVSPAAATGLDFGFNYDFEVNFEGVTRPCTLDVWQSGTQ